MMGKALKKSFDYVFSINWGDIITEREFQFSRAFANQGAGSLAKLCARGMYLGMLAERLDITVPPNSFKSFSRVGMEPAIIAKECELFSSRNLKENLTLTPGTWVLAETMAHFTQRSEKQTSHLRGYAKRQACQRMRLEIFATPLHGNECGRMFLGRDWNGRWTDSIIFKTDFRETQKQLFSSLNRLGGSPRWPRSPPRSPPSPAKPKARAAPPPPQIQTTRLQHKSDTAEGAGRTTGRQLATKRSELRRAFKAALRRAKSPVASTTPSTKSILVMAGGQTRPRKKRKVSFAALPSMQPPFAQTSSEETMEASYTRVPAPSKPTLSIKISNEGSDVPDEEMVVTPTVRRAETPTLSLDETYFQPDDPSPIDTSERDGLGTPTVRRAVEVADLRIDVQLVQTPVRNEVVTPTVGLGWELHSSQNGEWHYVNNEQTSLPTPTVGHVKDMNEWPKISKPGTPTIGLIAGWPASVFVGRNCQNRKRKTSPRPSSPSRIVGFEMSTWPHPPSLRDPMAYVVTSGHGTFVRDAPDPNGTLIGDANVSVLLQTERVYVDKLIGSGTFCWAHVLLSPSSLDGWVRVIEPNGMVALQRDPTGA